MYIYVLYIILYNLKLCLNGTVVSVILVIATNKFQALRNYQSHYKAFLCYLKAVAEIIPMQTCAGKNYVINLGIYIYIII